MNSNESRRADRVQREKDAHNVDGVLQRSIDLKGRFPHSTDNPAHNAMIAKLDRIVAHSKGLRVLDVGCGFGDDSLKFIESGAGLVAGIDISEANISTCRAKLADKINCSFEVMDVHAMTFASESFDLVFGRGILHHLEMAVALREISRVLAPGGRAIFQEPLGSNPLLKLFRLLTPSARTEDEKPLFRRDLDEIADFWDVESEYFGLVSAPIAMLTSVIVPRKPSNFVADIAFSVECKLRHVKFLDAWHQYVVLDLRKPEPV